MSQPSNVLNNGQATNLDWLPTELLDTLFSLARPRSATASACRSAYLIATQSLFVQRAWRNRFLLGDGEALSVPRSQDTETCLIPAAILLERDHLTLALRSQLPSFKGLNCTFTDYYSNSLCPLNSGGHASSLFTVNYVKRYLFSSSGPLLRSSASHTKSGVQQAAALAQELNQRWYQCHKIPTREGIYWSVPWRPWNRVLDPLLLVVFFLRSGQLDLFQFALQQLVAVRPWLTSDSNRVSVSRWTLLCIDHQYSLRARLSAFITDRSIGPTARDPFIPFSVFLSIIAIYNWSIPALDIITTTLSVSPTDIAPWIAQRESMLNGSVCGRHLLDMFKRLLQEPPDVLPPDFAERAVEVFSWVKRHCEASWLSFPFSEMFLDSPWPIVSRLALEIDWPSVDTLSNPQRGRGDLASVLLARLARVDAAEHERAILPTLKSNGLLALDTLGFFLFKHFQQYRFQRGYTLDWQFLESQVDVADVPELLRIAMEHLKLHSPATLLTMIVSLPSLAFAGLYDPIPPLIECTLQPTMRPCHLLSALTIAHVGQSDVSSWLNTARLSQLVEHFITAAPTTDLNRSPCCCLLLGLLFAQFLLPLTSSSTRGAYRSHLACLSRQQLAMLLACHFVTLFQSDISWHSLMDQRFYLTSVTNALVNAYENHPDKSKSARKGARKGKAAATFLALVPQVYRDVLADQVKLANMTFWQPKLKAMVSRIAGLDADFVREACQS